MRDTTWDQRCSRQSERTDHLLAAVTTLMLHFTPMLDESISRASLTLGRTGREDALPSEQPLLSVASSKIRDLPVWGNVFCVLRFAFVVVACTFAVTPAFDAPGSFAFILILTLEWADVFQSLTAFKSAKSIRSKLPPRSRPSKCLSPPCCCVL